jgi:signal transduction histidine kinase
MNPPGSAETEAALRGAPPPLSDLDATTRLLRIGTLFLREGNVQEILYEIVDAAIAMSGAAFGNVQLLDPASGDLKIAAHRGFPPWWVEYWDRVTTGHGVCVTALGQRTRVIVEDVEQSPIFRGTPALAIQRRAGVRAVQSTPLIGRGGEPIGMLSTHYRQPTRPSDGSLRLIDLLARQAADILERASAEAALKEANARLLEADRRKNEFLAVLSHELRNPLAPIRNSLRILLAHPPPGAEQMRRAQAVIGRQTAHLSHLVDDLLEIGRIVSNRVQLRPEHLDLGQLARDTAEDHRSVFTERGVTLETRSGEGAVPVNGDRTRLAQAIGNMLQNAAKFTPRGGKATLAVDIDAARARAIVRVKDTGRGIAPDLLPRVFEPFAQADVSLDRAEGGLGLGLAIVKSLVELHAGSVSAENRGDGDGATFTIELPLATAPVEACLPPAAALSPPPRVLVIEDNVDGAESLAELLTLYGHEALVAYDGREGLEKARVFGPDVVLCDIGLPGMDGYEVARAMRADPALRQVRLVALTGYARPEDVAKAKAAGFDVHVPKPPDVEALERAMAAIS